MKPKRGWGGGCIGLVTLQPDLSTQGIEFSALLSHNILSQCDQPPNHGAPGIRGLGLVAGTRSDRLHTGMRRLLVMMQFRA
jgi:hypothetical protein